MCFLLSMALTGLSQQGSNPFEIIRTGDSKTDTNTTKSRAQTQANRQNSGNEFEVFRDDDASTPNPALSTPAQDSIAVNNASESANNLEPGEVDIDDNDMDYMSDNPFEVSHIPLRRSELKEQSGNNDVATVTKSTKRSIVNTKSTSNTFIFWLVLFTLLLLAIVVNVQRNAISKVVKSITNENVLKLSKREENSGLTGHYIMLYVVFFINLACFIYLMAKNYTGFDGFSNWLYVFGAVAGVYVTRHLSMSFIGQIFDVSKDSSLYSFTIMTFNIFLGLALMPINLIVAFSPPEISTMVMYIGIGLILILLLIRLLRGLLIGVRFIGDHIFQFFLYLCTFEIAPILILLRILGDQ